MRWTRGINGVMAVTVVCRHRLPMRLVINIVARHIMKHGVRTAPSTSTELQNLVSSAVDRFGWSVTQELKSKDQVKLDVTMRSAERLVRSIEGFTEAEAEKQRRTT